MRQRVLRIYFERPPVLTLRLWPIARIEMYSAQVHQRAGGRRIEFRSLAVRRNYLLHWRARLFEFEPLFKPMLGLALSFRPPRDTGLLRRLPGERQQLLDFGLIEI